jgi:S1 RNA binding domain
MVLEGRITNVTGFGAFVNVGVHTDGLVHVSQFGRNFMAMGPSRQRRSGTSVSRSRRLGSGAQRPRELVSRDWRPARLGCPSSGMAVAWLQKIHNPSST